jgi:streptogramin lyase
MSVQRSIALFVLAFVLLPVVAGCGGAAVPGASASVPVGAGATPPAASPPAGQLNNPPLVDAKYTTGTFHVEVTGDVTKTFDAALQGSVSFTSEGSTILSYADPTTGDGGGVVLSAAVNGVTVSSPAISTGGSNADSNVCAVVVTQSDASRVAGTFDCRRVLGVVAAATSATNVTVDVRGTFEANR